jgi:hypothetical protein
MSRGRPAAWVVAAAAVLAAVAFGFAPAAAFAAPDLEIAIEDERLLLDQQGRAPAVVAEWASLGVQAVRVHARWGEIAPGRDAKARPKTFVASDPQDRRYDWDKLDRAIGLVGDAGMKVELTVTGPGPLWTSRAPRLKNPVWMPDPRAFASFTAAVARRYHGRIARYLIWNEPNVPGWLAPQTECRGARATRVCVPVSPHLYRSLVRNAVPVIRRFDPKARILLGELAPVGDPLRSESSTVAPLRFIRDMACLDGRYKPLRSERCRSFLPASADGFGHHPHGKRSAPDEPSKQPDWAKMGDLPRLERVLDRVTATGRLRAPNDRFDLYLTEFAYQTSPPDHFSGITVAHQAEWLQQASYLAWRNPRVKSLTHYQWEDEPVRWRGLGSLSYAGWQSGLLYVNGKRKPALSGFRSPLVIDRSGGGDPRVWGQVRPGGAHTVTVERREPSGWEPLATVETDDDGYFVRTLAVRPGDRLLMSWPADPAADPPAVERSGIVTLGAPRATGSSLASPPGG